MPIHIQSLGDALKRIQDSLSTQFSSGNKIEDTSGIDVVPSDIDSAQVGPRNVYVTHRPVDVVEPGKETDYNTSVMEQEEEEEEEEEKAPIEEPEETPDIVPTEEPEEAGMEEPTAVGGGEMGTDTGMGMMGMGEEETGPKTSGELGRIYELKKVYSRLVSIESYLSDNSDVTLIKLRQYVSQAIDLYKSMIFNIELFKDKMDEIIIVFYKFVEMSYEILRKYYENKKKRGEK